MRGLRRGKGDNGSGGALGALAALALIGIGLVGRRRGFLVEGAGHGAELLEFGLLLVEEEVGLFDGGEAVSAGGAEEVEFGLLLAEEGVGLFEGGEAVGVVDAEGFHLS